MNWDIVAKINQRERQMLVHSYIYYMRDDSIISDEKWAEWALELRELIHSYPEEFKSSVYWVDFTDWDGSTGFHLNLTRPEIVGAAERLLYLRDQKGGH